MYRIEFDPFYELELEQILISIIAEYSMNFAEKVAASLDAVIQQLKEYSKIYAVYADIPIYRKLVIEHKYTVFYTVDDDKKIVRFVHIFPSIRDLPNLLR
ncbi:MAG: type II toxin-antitoxin system RelE/ParE family toxin [Neisseriaceae bacterium]|nr:type II toxin-antitoxin system RelE/ParE family toxin [Neisseriaceae bacterium]MBP5790155.1 type II toxin-antitoxin system RelE/ParE family toxin [Neisseriaceae bacterium]